MSKRMRFLYFVTSVFLLELANWYVRGQLRLPSDSHIIWFQAGFLALSLGVFFTEHQYTKPTDAIATSLSLFYTIATLQYPPYLLWWNALMVLCFFVTCGCLFLFAFSEKDYDNHPQLRKLNKSVYLIIKEFGSAKFLASSAFILGIISFVEPAKHWPLFLGWATLILIQIGNPQKRFQSFVLLWREWNNETVSFYGYVTKFEEPNILYITVEGHNVHVNQILTLTLTPVFSEDQSLNVMIVSMLSGNTPVARAIILDNQANVWIGQRYAFIVPQDQKKFCNSTIYRNREKLVGFVAANSEIGILSVHVYRDTGFVSNYDILEALVNNQSIFYQITNAIVKEEVFQNDIAGYKRIIAVQVGTWDSCRKCFNDFRWVPQLNTPIFKATHFSETVASDRQLIQIGTFNTGHPIYAKAGELVTHNAALLGVTGSGKSYLGYSIIEGLTSNGIKVICIDNSGDYLRQVRSSSPLIINQPSEIDSFLASSHLFAVATATQVSSALDIIRKVYTWAQTQYNPNQNEIVPRICVFMEEAHSLIPEWNSTVNSSDQQLVNQISKYVMQGRKFGCGVIVVTQRTANVTKSILSQCNTIISFQAFDKTSNDFLSSFMDTEYVENISRLGLGCAIVAGKALTSGRPVVIRSVQRPEIQS